MPAKRTYRKRRQGRKKYVRKARMYKAPRGNMQVMNIKRTYVQNLAPGTYPHGGQIVPTLDSFPSYLEFTELYSQYRINKVKIKFIPTFNMGDGLNATTVGANGLFYGTTKNRNGSFADFNTENEFLESADGQWAKPISTPRKWYYTPNILTEQYKTAATTGYSFAYKRWLNSGDPTIPHYGFAYYILGFSPNTGLAPASGTTIGRFYITAYLQLKGVK